MKAGERTSGVVIVEAGITNVACLHTPMNDLTLLWITL